VIALAVGDIHAPIYFNFFKEALEEIYVEPEVVFLLGDIIDTGRHHYLKKVYETIKQKFPNAKIFSVFGNNEYFEIRQFLKKEYHYFNWLDDEAVELNDYIIIGTEGILDKLTLWQRKHMPFLKDLWNKRLEKLKSLFEKYKDKKIILLSHYAPVCKTCEGDPAPRYYLCSKRFEELIRKYQPDYVFHAHCHMAKILETTIGKTKVYNASLYARNELLVLEI